MIDVQLVQWLREDQRRWPMTTWRGGTNVRYGGGSGRDCGWFRDTPVL